MTQRQFLDVVDENVAHAAFREACAHLAPRIELIPADRALGRALGPVVVGFQVFVRRHELQLRHEWRLTDPSQEIWDCETPVTRRPLTGRGG